MLDSIKESFEKQAREQGRPIYSSEDRFYLGYFNWEISTEGEIFWNILYASYLKYKVYDYETLIKIYIRFNSVPNKSISIHSIYSKYFDKEKGTLTDEGFERLIKKIR